MKKFFLIFLFLFANTYAGRELWHPSDKLNEFIMRRIQIMTHISSKKLDDIKWGQEFEKLWNEVEQAKESFNNYFITYINVTTNEQKKAYDDFIKELIKNRMTVCALTIDIDEAIGENILRSRL